MSFQPTFTQIGLPAINSVVTPSTYGPLTSTQAIVSPPVGTRVKAVDPVYGEGEFIFLPGVASTVVGSAVIFNEVTPSTTLTLAASRGPIGISMSANNATTTYGWYQIAGAAVVVSATATAALKPYVNAAAGSLISTVVTTNGVDGAVFESATGTPATGFAVVTIERPAANGNG